MISSVQPNRNAASAEQSLIERAAQFDRHIADPIAKNRALMNLYEQPMATRLISVAKPLPGGVSAWDSEVERESPAYAAAVVEWLDPSPS